VTVGPKIICILAVVGMLLILLFILIIINQFGPIKLVSLGSQTLILEGNFLIMGEWHIVLIVRDINLSLSRHSQVGRQSNYQSL
jgi:hypothetical protein